jgi:anaerobic magnesium-protoporphyrin IX monomethyl ester cyclase
MARALADARCIEAWIGAESGSQKILDAMHKGTSIADIHTATARLRAHGVRVCFFIQLGYLNEELEDILATRELIETLRPDDIGVSVSYPLPGTRFYEMVKHQLRAKTRWQESNDLSMMFEGTYCSDFYRTVRDLLHEQVTLEGRHRSRHDAAYLQSRSSLEKRWNVLIEHEPLHRSDSRAASN